MRRIAFIFLVSIISFGALSQYDDPRVHDSIALKYFEAEFLVNKGRFLEALVIFEDYEGVYKSMYPISDIDFNMAQCLVGIGDYDDAIVRYNQYLETAVPIQKKCFKVIEAYQNLGRSHLKKGNYPQTKKYIDEAISLLNHCNGEITEFQYEVLKGNCHYILAMYYMNTDDDGIKVCENFQQSKLHCFTSVEGVYSELCE